MTEDIIKLLPSVSYLFYKNLFIKLNPNNLIFNMFVIFIFIIKDKLYFSSPKSSVNSILISQI